jgi:uroporphyrinogen-III synthase
MFEQARPLQGRRILVTRAPHQSDILRERLRALGATPVEFPTIQMGAPADWAALDEALGRLCATRDDRKGSPLHLARPPGYEAEPGRLEEIETRFASAAQVSYDWLVFTSANGVRFCFERLQSLGYDTSAVGKVRIVAIGPATAALLEHYGMTADLVPKRYIAEGVAAALVEEARRQGEALEGKRILLVRAVEARNVLVSELQRAGALVDIVAAYRTIGIASDDERGSVVLRLLQHQQLAILTFTSSSTVRNFMQWLIDGERSVTGSFTNLITHNPQLKVASIGPVTSQTARELGLEVDIEASKFTVDGLVEAIVRYEEKYGRADNSDPTRSGGSR